MIENTEPSSLHAHLGYWLRMVSNAISQGFARRLEAEGVTVAEWVFLRMLYDAGEIAPSSLAERMGMTRGAISKLADRLVDKKLVEREANPGDKRGQTLALAKPAKALVLRLAKLADENDAEFFGVLTAAERMEVERLLKKIVLEHRLAEIPLS
jgi:MarR family transcriptional regulator, lower aerobic nicotinate degradation pathway regulator